MESLRMWIATLDCIMPVFFRRGRLAEYMQPKCRDSIGGDHIVWKLILSYELQCFTRIFHVKNTIFFTCVWYRQSAADTSLAFRATRSGWWMNGEALTILNPWLFVRIFSDYGCLNTEKSVSLTDIDFQSFVEAVEKPKYEEKNRKLRIQRLW